MKRDMKNGWFFNKCPISAVRETGYQFTKKGPIMKTSRILAVVAMFVSAGTGSAHAEQGISGTTTITVTVSPELLAALRGKGYGVVETGNGPVAAPVSTIVTDNIGDDGNTIIRTIETF